MARPIVVFGAGEIAQIADFYFNYDKAFEVAAFVVDDVYRNAEQFCDRPLVALSQLANSYPSTKFGAFVALSYAQMNKVRASKCDALRSMGYDLVTYLSPRASCFTKNIGWNCFILEDNTIQPFVTVGNNVTLWSGNHIGHHSTICENTFISSHVVVSGGVTIGRNCFIGVNSTLRDHIKVGDETLVGAGVYLNKDTAPQSVYKGPKFDAAAVKSGQIKI